jgi:hypothetical protein
MSNVFPKVDAKRNALPSLILGLARVRLVNTVRQADLCSDSR